MEDEEYDEEQREREEQDLLRQQRELEWQERRRRRMVRRMSGNGANSGSFESDPHPAGLVPRHPLDSAYCASSPSLVVDYHQPPIPVIKRVN
jgi:hypothetical protein